MNALDAAWHLFNLLSPAAFIGLAASVAAKLIWRQALHATPWTTLFIWAAAPALLVTLGGLAWTGRDGKMSTYAAMVFASALGLWWRIPGRS